MPRNSLEFLYLLWCKETEKRHKHTATRGHYIYRACIGCGKTCQLLFQILKRTNSCQDLIHIFALLLLFTSSYMQLTPLFVWLCSQPLSHPWPSAQIYLLTINQLLVSFGSGIQCGDVEWGKGVQGMSIKNIEQMCLKWTVWLHTSSVIKGNRT